MLMLAVDIGDVSCHQIDFNYEKISLKLNFQIHVVIFLNFLSILIAYSTQDRRSFQGKNPLVLQNQYR